MLRKFLTFFLCLFLLPLPDVSPVASQEESSAKNYVAPVGGTSFHFFSPEAILANYRKPRTIRVGYFDQHGVFEGEQLSGYAVALFTAISRYGLGI